MADTVLDVTNATLQGQMSGPEYTGDISNSLFTGSITIADTTTPPDSGNGGGHGKPDKPPGKPDKPPK